MNNKSRERSYKQIAKLVGELAETYDSVQIFVTKHTDKGKNLEDTESIYYGVGNKFAIYGQIRSWMLIEEQKLKNIADLEFDLDNSEEEEDDGEDQDE
jgi:hypothetical protein